MDNELNRYYRKIPTTLQIDSKTIHEELVTALGSSAPLLQDGQSVFVKKEKMSMIILNLLVQYPNLQVKRLNWFDKLLTMIHIQLMMKRPFSHDTMERIIHDWVKMKKVISHWISLMNNELNFVMKIWRNFKMVPEDYVIL